MQNKPMNSRAFCNKASIMLDHAKSSLMSVKSSESKGKVPSTLHPHETNQMTMPTQWRLSPKVLGRSIKGVLYPLILQIPSINES
jgi:hypothetical protein